MKFAIIIFIIAVGHILLGFGYLIYKIGYKSKSEKEKQDKNINEETDR